MAPARRRIRAVVYDLDDTLYLERRYVRGGFSAVGEFLRQTLGGAQGDRDFRTAGQKHNVGLIGCDKDVSALVNVCR